MRQRDQGSPDPEESSETSGAHRLGGLQHQILRVLWRREEASALEVRDALPAAWRRAPTTIATMLTKLERKGAVAHRTEGRQFVYRALVAERDVRRTMVGDLTERLFHGDAVALASHLIFEENIDPDELARLQALIEARRAELDGGER